MSVGHIDPAAFQETAEFIRQYELYRSDAGIVSEFNSINLARPTHLDEQVFHVLRERVAKYAAYHDTFPFLVPPKETLHRGPILIGHDYATLTPIGLSLLDATRHILIAGTTGSGKTTVATRIIETARAAGIKVWIVDPKDDYRHLAVRDSDFLIFHPDVPINLLEREAHLSSADVRNAFIMALTIGLWLGVVQAAVLADAFKRIESEQETFTVRDLKRVLDGTLTTKGTYARREQARSVSIRLEQFIDQFPGPCTTPVGIPLSTLYEHSLYLPVTPDQGPIGQFLLFSILHRLYLYQLRRQHRGTLSHLVVIDEALVALGSSANTPDGRTPVSHLQNLARELGIGIVVLTTNLQLTDALTQSNAGTVVSLKTNGATETATAARTLGLTPDQARFHQTRLTPGLGVVRLNSWGHPILAAFDPPPIGFSKTVDASEWSDAIHRTDSLAPRLATTANEYPLQFTPKALPPPATLTELPAETTNGTVPTRTIALNDAQEGLLRSAVQRIAPTTAHYAALDLHPEEGTRAKKTLVALGLAVEERIVVRSGRGGTALALVLTPSGITRSGLTPPRGTRGGDSVQHRFLVSELAALVPKSTVEALVGTKSCDLVIAYNAAIHAALAEFLAANSQEAIPLNDSDVVAIEVEVSSPDRTIPSNIEKNCEAGIPETIVAVLPKNLAVARRTIDRLPDGLRRTVALVDVLRLLDHLRGRPSHAS
jgi:Helicase HerA, central domain